MVGGDHVVSVSAHPAQWDCALPLLNHEIIKAENRFTFHDIRAKHATDKDEQGLNAQLALGHPDPKMTAKYIRHRKGRKIDTLKTELVKGKSEKL